MQELNIFQKQKDFLVCVDSDGCAMDTMDIKHFRCFGPCMVEEWGLEAWEKPILDRWNEINLLHHDPRNQPVQGPGSGPDRDRQAVHPHRGGGRAGRLGRRTPRNSPTGPSPRPSRPPRVLPWPKPSPGLRRSTPPSTPCPSRRRNPLPEWPRAWPLPIAWRTWPSFPAPTGKLWKKNGSAAGSPIRWTSSAVRTRAARPPASPP